MDRVEEIERATGWGRILAVRRATRPARVVLRVAPARHRDNGRSKGRARELASVGLSR